jgi:hypothetical protein
MGISGDSVDRIDDDESNMIQRCLGVETYPSGKKP